MAGPTLTANSPSAGYIAWTAFHIQYLGQSYAIAAGSTNSKYTYWLYNNGAGGPLQFTDDVNVVAALTSDDLVLFLNKSGTPVNALTATVLDGSLIVPGSILAEAIAANTITSDQIAAEGIVGANIAAGTITSDLIGADQILASKIAAGNVQAKHLESDLLLSSRIVGGGSLTGARAEINTNGFEAYNASGTKVFYADLAGDVFLSGSVQSDDYEEAIQGWRLDSNTAQVSNLNVLDTVGANVVTGQSVTVDGQDIMNDLIPSRSQGAAAYGMSVTGTDSNSITSSNNGWIISKFLPGTIRGDRLYAIYWHFVANPDTPGMQIGSRLTFTTDGTYPGKGSPVMPGTEGYVYAGSGKRWVYYNGFTVYNPNAGPVDVDLKIGVWAFTNDANASFVVKNSATTKQEFLLLDLGPQIGTPNALQIVNMNNTADDPTPVQTYTKNYNPTWSQSYDGDGSKYAGGDKGNCYQGEYDGTHGNTKSLVGYNDSQMRSDLAGSTIKKVTLTYRVKHSYYNAGMNVVVHQHNHSGIPTTYGDGAQIDSHSSVSAGQTVTVTLPDSFGNDLRDGNAAGIAFHTSSTSLSDYGYLYGNNTGSGPKITVTYEK